MQQFVQPHLMIARQAVPAGGNVIYCTSQSRPFPTGFVGRLPFRMVDITVLSASRVQIWILILRCCLKPCASFFHIISAKSMR